jgi:hypothetical protein
MVAAVRLLETELNLTVATLSIGAQSSTAGHGGSPLSGCENIQRATPIRSLLAQPPICHAAFGLISSVGDCLSFEDHTFLESGWI